MEQVGWQWWQETGEAVLKGGAPCRGRMGFPANVLSFLWNQMKGWVGWVEGDLRRDVTGKWEKSSWLVVESICPLDRLKEIHLL